MRSTARRQPRCKRRSPAPPRRYSPILTPAEQPVWNPAEVQERAKNEYIWHEGTVINANVTVQGWMMPGGGLWRAGDLVAFISPMTTLNMGLKIQNVTFTQDSQSGTLTTLELVAPWLLKDYGDYNVGRPGAPPPPKDDAAKTNTAATSFANGGAGARSVSRATHQRLKRGRHASRDTTQHVIPLLLGRRRPRARRQRLDNPMMQEMAGSFMKGESREEVEAPQNYGFTSRGAAGDQRARTARSRNAPKPSCRSSAAIDRSRCAASWTIGVTGRWD